MLLDALASAAGPAPVLCPTDAGRRVAIRPARAEDRAMYVAALAELSPQSMYQRFLAPIPRMSEREIDRLMDLDPDRQHVWFAVDPLTGAGAGAARLAASGPGVAEVAIAVVDAWQRQGLGSELLDVLIGAASELGVVTVTADALSENRGASRLLKSRGFRRGAARWGVTHWSRAVEAPVPFAAA